MKRNLLLLGLLAVTRLFAPGFEDFEKELKANNFSQAFKTYRMMRFKKDALQKLFSIDPLRIPVKDQAELVTALESMSQSDYEGSFASSSWQIWLNTNIPELDYVIVSEGRTPTPPPSESDGGTPPEAPEAPEAPPAPGAPSASPAAGGGFAQKQIEAALKGIETAASASAAFAIFKDASIAVKKQLYVPLLTTYNFADFKPGEKGELIASFFKNVSPSDAHIAAIKAKKPANASALESMKPTAEELERASSQEKMQEELKRRLGGGGAGTRKPAQAKAVTKADKEKVQAGLYTYARAQKYWSSGNWKETVKAFRALEDAANKKSIHKDVYKAIVEEMVQDLAAKWTTIPTDERKTLEGIVQAAGVKVPTK